MPPTLTVGLLDRDEHDDLELYRRHAEIVNLDRSRRRFNECDVVISTHTTPPDCFGKIYVSMAEDTSHLENILRGRVVQAPRWHADPVRQRPEAVMYIIEKALRYEL
jgi:hypothetical protein